MTQVLVAFVVPASPDAPPDEEKLRQLLGATLPAHMVPARIATLAALPTTPGGKLDRRSLPLLISTDPAAAKLSRREVPSRPALSRHSPTCCVRARRLR